MGTTGKPEWQTLSMPFWSLQGNAGTNTATDFFGTTDAKPINMRVNNARTLVIDVDSNLTFGGANYTNGGLHRNSVLLGGRGNNLGTSSGGNVYGNAIIGGANNRISGPGSNYSVIVGGNTSRISGNNVMNSSIIGGGAHQISGSNVSNVSIIGGMGGIVSNGVGNSSIIGATNGTLNASNSVVIGGVNNTASGINCVVLGGARQNLGTDMLGFRGDASTTSFGVRSFASASKLAAFVNVNLLVANDEADGVKGLLLAEYYPNGTNVTGFRAPSNLASDVVYTLPDAQGAAGTVLTNNGSGTLSWTSPQSSMWTLTGNSGTDSTINFLGTTDSRPLIVRTSNTERLRIRPTGQLIANGSVGIGGDP
jgi:hypothetical protein